MGLGLHGGGLASAKFFLHQGANLTITDLRSEEVLKPTMDQLTDYPIRYTLGKHIDEDFTNADIVIKNPGVPSSSPYLKLAKRVESDISIFLSRVDAPVIAITGSKGKSSTVSALYEVLKSVDHKVKLGGNITVSPLTFIDEVDGSSPVILELSSWQLADLRDKGVLKPDFAAITNIMNDHQNAYNSMDEYADDKAVILSGVQKRAILNYNDHYCKFFENYLSETPLYFSGKILPDGVDGAYFNNDREGYLRVNGKEFFILPKELSLKGEHQRENMLLAGMIAKLQGMDESQIREVLAKFTGIQHRMELFHEKDGVKFYNDSAATIPEAVVAALNSFEKPVRLISGGTDKELNFSGVESAFKKAKSIHLLAGTGTDKLIKELDKAAISYIGPFNSLKALIDDLKTDLNQGDEVLFSPGATSFGMFNNEFDRGNQFKSMILSI